MVYFLKFVPLMIGIIILTVSHYLCHNGMFQVWMKTVGWNLEIMINVPDVLAQWNFRVAEVPFFFSFQ